MLDIDLVTILAEILNFLVLAVVLYFLLFKPMVKRIEERARKKEALIEEAQEKQQQAEERLAEIEKRLSNIDSEIEVRLQKAYQEAQSESESLLEETQKEAEKILGEAQHEAAKRQQQEMVSLQNELAETILTISGQVLSRTAPDQVHEKLIEELNAEIWDLGKSDMRQVRTIRDSLADKTPTVFVFSARELSPEQQRSLVRTFSALVDSNVSMEIEINPDLIAGIRVRVGDLIVENSLAMELNELKDEVAESLEESLDAKA
jgi:F-type H+-transporting ATPase subunit b